MNNNLDLINSINNKRRFHYGDDMDINTTKGLYELITEFLSPSVVMCEIGNFEGVSSELFALHVKKIICVDPYVFSPHMSSYPGANETFLIDAEEAFIKMSQDYTNIVKIKKTSSEASTMFDSGVFDFVYVDGDHDYFNANNDMACWLPKIKKGGYMGGHDWGIEDVQKAIVDNDLEIIRVFSDTSWIAKV